MTNDRRRRVLAVWFDAAERLQIEALMSEGRLPHLSALKKGGAYAELSTDPFMLSERHNSTTMTGVSSESLGYWTSPIFETNTYTIRNQGYYKFDKAKPFYAYAGDARLIVFDPPKPTLIDNLPGIQVIGWGAHSTFAPYSSIPAGLDSDLKQRFGLSPTYMNDYAELNDLTSMKELFERLMISSKMRKEIFLNLLKEHPWELAFTAYGELHGGLHYFFPNSELPYSDELEEFGKQLYEEADRGLGEFLSVVDRDTTVIVFSAEGMAENAHDLPSMVYLPELLFRHAFPKAKGLDFSPESYKPSPERLAGIICWPMEIWNLHTRHKSTWKAKVSTWVRSKLSQRMAVIAERCLGFAPTLFQPEGFPILNYQPLMWSSPYWPDMRAFALPTFLSGLIRLNVRGRDKHGKIDPEDYDKAIAEITELLYELRDLRTGQPVINQIKRVRTKDEIFSTTGPDADLIIDWAKPASHGFSSRYGDIGPALPIRAASHAPHGFLIANGPDIEPGTVLKSGQTLDIAPTILQQLGITPPPHIEGKPLLPASEVKTNIKPKVPENASRSGR